MRVGILIQARMSSRRLPGKVLRPLAGKPVLGHVVDRCMRVEGADLVAVITSVEPSDDPVAAFAEDAGMGIFRGPLDDVAARFIGGAAAFETDAFVRVNADSPLLDPALLTRGIALFRGGGADLVSNVARRTFPTGLSVEVLDLARYETAYHDMNAEEREHVTLHYYRHPKQFRIASFESERELGDRTLSVDTLEDFERIEKIVNALERPERDHDWEATIVLAERLDALARRSDLAP
jgi:spore coat polysaccharide biosynthesis protein SpsF